MDSSDIAEPRSASPERSCGCRLRPIRKPRRSSPCLSRRSRERLYRLTRREVLALCAYKRRRADAVQKALYLPLLDRAHRDKRWFECGCRRMRSLFPDFHPRRHRNGEFGLSNRHPAPVMHHPHFVVPGVVRLACKWRRSWGAHAASAAFAGAPGHERGMQGLCAGRDGKQSR